MKNNIISVCYGDKGQMPKIRDSTPKVLGSINPEISYKVDSAKGSSGIVAMI